jgi:predicted Co/Zn/Cd cation transporter (cation efflux family)
MATTSGQVTSGGAAGASAGDLARLEQRTLAMSLAAVAGVALLSLAWGVARELLHMADADRELASRVEAVLRKVAAEYDVASHSTHVAKVGRASFIEANIVVGPRFGPQTVAQQDALRERIWRELGLTRDRAWLSIIMTSDPRWA